MRLEQSAALDANWTNRQERPNSGVVGYDAATDDQSTGPCAVTVGSSGDSLEVRVAPGTIRVAGTRVDVADQTVTLAAADPDLPSKDVIYVGADGVADDLIGEAREPTTVELDDGSTVTLDREQAPEPAPPATSGLNGAVLAVVWKPPGASTTSDLTAADIQDRRKPPAGAAEEMVEISGGFPHTEILAEAPDDRVSRGTALMPGQSLELKQWGVWGWDDGSQTQPPSGVSLELRGSSGSTLESTSDIAASGTPIITVTNESDATELYHFMLVNNSGIAFERPEGLGAEFVFDKRD